MHFYTSNFYQVRNMPKDMLPLSVNQGEPKWFHDNKGRNYIFQDKRGVWNGGYIDEISSSNLNCNSDECINCVNGEKEKRNDCAFIKAFLEKLQKLDFKKTIIKLTKLAEHFKCNSICFVVFEKPEIICGERVAIKKWFEENNTHIEEFFPFKKIGKGFSLNFKKT